MMKPKESTRYLWTRSEVHFRVHDDGTNSFRCWSYSSWANDRGNVRHNLRSGGPSSLFPPTFALSPLPSPQNVWSYHVFGLSELTMFTIRSLWWAPVTIQFLPFNMSHLQRNCSQFSLTVVVHNHAKTLPVENLYWKVAWAHLSTFDSYCHNPYFISTL